MQLGGPSLRKNIQITHTKCPQASRRDPGNEEPAPQVLAGGGFACSFLTQMWPVGAPSGEGRAAQGRSSGPERDKESFVSSNSCCDCIIVK